jgi:hypothetical protein
MKKTLIILIAIGALSLIISFGVRPSSAQYFYCALGEEGGGEVPGPTPRPDCYEQSFSVTETHCDYIAGFCSVDEYLIVERYCNRVLVRRTATLLHHYEYEI